MGKIAFVFLGAIAGVVAMFLICGLWMAISIHNLDSAEAATWVQSVGLVLGVAVAIWVPNIQRADAIKERTRTHQELTEKNYKLLCIGIGLICDAIHDLNEIAEEGNPVVYGVGMTQRVRDHREFMCKHSFLELTEVQIKAMGKILDVCSAAIAVMQPENLIDDPLNKLLISSVAIRLVDEMKSARADFERP